MRNLKSVYNQYNKRTRRPSLDVHGYYVHSAWKEVAKFIEECYYNDIHSCEIICGQGAMAREISEWFRLNRYVKTYKSSRGGGSYNVKLKKRKTEL